MFIIANSPYRSRFAAITDYLENFPDASNDDVVEAMELLGYPIDNRTSLVVSASIARRKLSSRPSAFWVL